MRVPLPIGYETIADKTELLLAIRPEHVVLAAADEADAVQVNVEFIDNMGAIN